MRSGVLLILAVLTLMCRPASATAQPATEVSGSVSDETGARLPGVRVTIRGIVDRAVETAPDGSFTFSGLADGDYEISAELAGFEAVLDPEVDDLVVALDEPDLIVTIHKRRS